MSARLGELEQLVLLALLDLQREGQGHGPALQNRLGYAGRRLSLGAICRTLHRLEQKELVQGRLGDPLRMPGGRRKREYQVTPEGLEALRASIAMLRHLFGRTEQHRFVGAVYCPRTSPRIRRFGSPSER